MYIKICGATSPADIDILAGLGVDYAGIWHGTGGRSEVDLATLARLCAHASGRVHPVLVTLTSDLAALTAAAAASGVRWIQLHGYQTPSAVRRLKAAGLSIIKALHVRGEECVEQSLIASYERAGVDLFLLDTLTDDGRVGSTGRRLAPAVVDRLAAHLNRPFLLAGGVSANRTAFGDAGRFGPGDGGRSGSGGGGRSRSGGDGRSGSGGAGRSEAGELGSPGLGGAGRAGAAEADGGRWWPHGVDVDSAARGPDGRLCPSRVADIVAAWRPGSRG